jgi:hypothetical protein
MLDARRPKRLHRRPVSYGSLPLDTGGQVQDELEFQYGEAFGVYIIDAIATVRVGHFVGLVGPCN